MEKYLPQCIDSLLVEKIDSLDILIINDGSKDRTLEIGRRYETKYPQSIRVIDKSNGNYGSCINRGLKEAVGKYIKVLDADECNLPARRRHPHPAQGKVEGLCQRPQNEDKHAYDPGQHEQIAHHAFPLF